MNNLSKEEEKNLLEQIYRTPHFKLVQSYVKQNCYIGSGAHRWGWNGVQLYETLLQDGETAPRLLSNYSVPKNHPIVENFVAAMRNEETLREEFAYIPSEISQYENRFAALKSGGSLMKKYISTASNCLCNHFV